MLNLEKEWSKLPLLSREWTKKLARAELELSEAKDNMKYVTAKLAKDIRENPDNYDLSKVTDKSVEQYIPLQKAYRDALDEINQCKYNVDIIDSMVQAIQDKRRALENEVKLYGLQYWDSPNVSKELREAIESAETTEVYRRGHQKRREEEDD